MTTERIRTVKGLLEEHRRRRLETKGSRKRKSQTSIKIGEANSLSKILAKDGIRLKDIRRGAGLGPTA